MYPVEVSSPSGIEVKFWEWGAVVDRQGDASK
jgi:hypothetical protein